MTPLYVCTQTVDRYDCLARLIASCAASTRRPDAVFIVDHGYNEAGVRAVVEPVRDGLDVNIITLEDPSCAVNGNWFLKNVPDDRVGVGDDFEFMPTALELLANTPGDYIIPNPVSAREGTGMVNPSACALVRSSCVEKVGYYDELISPGYLYFEDPDYFRRMELAGVSVTQQSEARVVHQDGGSQTYHSMRRDSEVYAEHCYRFWMAKANYEWKWGGEPFKETLRVPRPLPRPHGWPNGDTKELPPRTKADVIKALRKRGKR